METALQQEQQDMLDERLASLGAYRSYYQGLPPPIIRCHSPIVRMCSSTSSSSTTMTTPRSSPQHWSMKSPFTSPTTTVATTNSSLASMGSASFLAPPLLSHGIVSPPKVVSVASSSNSSSTSFDAESSFDHVQVVVRLRPTRPFDRAWEVKDEGTVLQQRIGTHKAAPSKTYCYDHVLAEATTNTEVYRKVAQPIVKAVSQNKHGTVFAYGQTGSGKTHTMQGTRSEPGIIEMAATDLFQWISATDDDCTVKVQYFEIYNETVRDLLASPKAANSSLSVREDKYGNIALNASEVEVHSVQAVTNLLQQGNRIRAMAATLLNSKSSRSHAIYRLSLERRSRHQSAVAKACTVISVLNLVDLAGSESSMAAATVGAQQREAGKINQSLLALSRVVQALSLPENRRPARIAYRDSKLTRILQQHLQGGAACLALLCCVSGSRQHVQETKSTLQFATSAKQIVIRPTENVAVVDSKTLQLVQLQRELAETKKALYSLQYTTEEKFESNNQELSVSSANAVFESLSEPDEIWSVSERSFVSGPLETNDPPVPDMIVMIQNALPTSSDNLSFQTKLEESEQRAKNLEERLQASDAVANMLFQNFKDARERYRSLERLNQYMGSCDDLKLLLQHSFLQRVALLASLTLLYHGQLEIFATLVCFLFVSLEVATS